jgi:hydroxyethylthiazole kinase-like uncharacterized protein yjeF
MTDTVPTYSADQVRAAERPLLDAGVPLMRRAATALAGNVRAELAGMGASAVPPASHALEPVLPSAPDRARPRVLVLAGSGDNGGDALYAAAQLTGDADVDALLVADHFHEPAFAAAIGAGVRRIELAEVDDGVGAYALVIDGILGIGATRDPALRGTAREAVSSVLAFGKAEQRMPRVIAVDIPSGLHPDTGAADDVVLPASVTVTFGAVKAGLASGRGPALAGDIVLVDIGLAPGLRGVVPAGEASVARVVDAAEG